MLMSKRRLVSTLVAFLAVGLMACGPDAGDDDDNDNDTNDNQDPDTCVDFDAGDLSGATLDGNCYDISGSTTIDDGTLTIEAGTTIYFGQGEGLSITGGGILNAEGTEDEPIRLLGAQDELGYWDGVHFNDSPSSDNILQHVSIENAGGSQWRVGRDLSQGGLVIREGTRLQVTDSEFRRNQYSGISVESDDAEVDVTGSLFEDNEAYPIRLYPNQIGAIGEGNEYVDNGDQYIQVDGSSTITSSTTWQAQEIPFRPNDRFAIEADVTVSPGTAIHFEQGAGFSVDEGSFQADASGEDAIELMGTDDDQGHWRGIRTRTRSGDNQLENVVIDGAGAGQWRSGRDASQTALYVTDDANMEINDSTVSNSGGHGLSADGADAEVTGCDDLEFDGNAGDDEHTDNDGKVCE